MPFVIPNTLFVQISEVVLDKELFTEINKNDILDLNNIHGCMKDFYTAEQLIRTSFTQCQITILQKLTATILRTFAFLSHGMYTNTSADNKHVYIADRLSCDMLKLAAKFGFVSDLLYIAIYHYKTFRYREALSVLEMTKVKLAQPGLMYMGHVDPQWCGGTVLDLQDDTICSK